jgi:hypothetical protein
MGSASVRAITRSLTIACMVLFVALAGLALEHSGSGASRTRLQPISKNASASESQQKGNANSGESVADKGADAKPDGNKKCEGDKDAPTGKSANKPDNKKCRPPSGDDHDHDKNHDRGGD